MSDFNGIDTGSKIELDPINGRIADGVRLKDVKTLAEIQSATSFTNAEVASASAVADLMENQKDSLINELNLSHTTASGQRGASVIKKTLTKGIWLITFSAQLQQSTSTGQDFLVTPETSVPPQATNRDALYSYIDGNWNGFGIQFVPYQFRPMSSCVFIENVTNETSELEIKEYFNDQCTVKYSLSAIKIV